MQTFRPVFWIILLTGICMLLLNVLQVDTRLYNTNQMAQILFYARWFPCVSVLFMPYAVGRLKQGVDPIFVLVFIWATWVCIRAPWPGVAYDEKLFYFLGCFAFFFITRLVFRDIRESKPDQFPRYMAVVAIGVVVLAIVEAGIGQLQVWGWQPSYHEDFAVTGTFFNPALYAAFLVASFPWCLYLATLPQPRGGWIALVSLGYVGAAVIVLLLVPSYSRAGYLGFAAAVSVWCFSRYNLVGYWRAVFHTRTRRLTVVALLVATITGTGVALYHFKQDSAFGRTLIWKISLYSVQDHVIAGHGFNRFPAAYGSQLLAYFQEGHGSPAEEYVAGVVSWAFNEPLQVLVELGIVGLIVLLSVVGYACLSPTYVQPGHAHAPLRTAAIASLAGLLVAGCFSYPFHSLPCVILFFLALAVLSAFAPAWRTRGVWVGNVAVLLFLAVLTGYYFTTTPSVTRAYRQWTEAKRLYDAEAYDLAADACNDALPVLKSNGYFLLQYARTLALNGQAKEALAMLEEGKRNYIDDMWYITRGNCYEMQGEYTQAEQCYQNAAQIIPHRFYPLYLLTMLYDKTGKKDSALKMARQILQKEAKIESDAVSEMKIEVRRIVERYQQ